MMKPLMQKLIEHIKQINEYLAPKIAKISNGIADGVQILDAKYPRLKDFIDLTRLNRPIGIYLLLWPTFWALWISAKGFPTLANLIIFTLGVILMRSAGCVINDYADRDFDGSVERTKHRPLATGRILPKEALILFSVLCLVAFGLVLMTNLFTILLSFGGVALAALYPFMKRYTYLPQVVLGAAFGWAVPMAFAAEVNSLPDHVWLIYCTTLLWTVAYDTQYAMVDRDDDLQIGVRSTAILFGDMDLIMIWSLQALALFCWLLVGIQIGAGLFFYLGMLAAIGCFIYQAWLCKDRDRDGCFKAFLNNHWAGLALFFGLFVHFL